MGYPVTIDEQMLVSAVRYALERKTYIVMSTCDSVRKAWPSLSLGARGVILRDIDTALDTAKAAGTTVGMAMDQQSWVSLLNDITSGTLLEPKPAAPDDDEDLGPDQGYPSEDELQRLASFRGTPRELIEYVESIWRNGAGSVVTRAKNHWGKEEVIATFVTGGWSGCESIISTLNRTLAISFSHSWQRGGAHSFAFPAKVYDSDKSWDWELLLHEPASDRGPYAYLRDRLATLEAAVDERVHELADVAAHYLAPSAGDLWALREEHVDDEYVYYFNGSYYVPEKNTNPWAGEIEPSDERLTGGRLLFRPAP